VPFKPSWFPTLARPATLNLNPCAPSSIHTRDRCCCCLPRNSICSPSYSSAWVSLPFTTTMKSSGVSRFLSRRDKHHHEKRPSKSTSKVRLPLSASCNSLTPLLRPSDETCDACFRRHRTSRSLEALYHKLPSPLRVPYVEERFIFFQRNAHSCPSFSPNIPRHSSNHRHKQLRPANVSSDLYTIFTNEDDKATADKDAEKKVRYPTPNVTQPWID